MSLRAMEQSKSKEEEEEEEEEEAEKKSQRKGRQVEEGKTRRRKQFYAQTFERNGVKRSGREEG
ncbi:hypothetical protein K0M31_018974 [Melipona bicolor]|uniref:Uncharacterized protein n=1 Tax=Melipona bicolor TaxID=60889 RepID=A0AA40KDX9_9HYME|nr:hypothetical protein K0M31_018974 [Melipona bicolor]